MDLKIRAAAAFTVLGISILYFLFFRQLNITYGHILYSCLIFACLVTAFMTKRRDVTMGILYGLSIVLLALMVIFIFFSEKL